MSLEQDSKIGMMAEMIAEWLMRKTSQRLLEEERCKKACLARDSVVAQHWGIPFLHFRFCLK